MRRHTTIFRTLTALAMAVVLFAGCLFEIPQVFAATQEANRMNVEVIIDGSNSLDWSNSPTDPEGYRFDAIDLFLALLTERGNNVGALVFHGSANTFQLDLDPAVLNGRDAKLALSEKIRSTETEGGTNIGAALLQGVQKAVQMHEENGLPSVVILFSDGKTDVSGGSEGHRKAMLAKEQATVLAQEQNIPVYTICLAATGEADPAELQDIATRTSGSYVKVQNAEALSMAFETFYKMIFGSSGKEFEGVIAPDGSLMIPFEIPAYGAEEVNIILDTRGLTGISVDGPEGTMSQSEIDGKSMQGGFYQVIKLVDPTSGKYFVKLQGAASNAVKVNVLFNIDSDAQLRTSDGKNSYAAGTDVVLQANLIQNGAPVMDPSVTTDYTAVLELTDLSSGQTTTHTMSPDGNGTFTYTLNGQPQTSLSAVAKLICGDLQLTTNVWTLDFDNTPPVADPATETVKKIVWPIFGHSHSLSMPDYFSDAQDGAPVRYQVLSSQLTEGSWKLDEATGELTVDIGSSRSGTLVIEGQDSQGAAAQLSIHYDITDVRLLVSGSTLLLIGGGGLAAFLIWVAINQKNWSGTIKVRNLTTGTTTSHNDFRGKLQLKRFGLGNCGMDGYFQALPRNGLRFVSKKPVYGAYSATPSKQIPLPGDSVTIYADENQTQGIEVMVDAREVRGPSGFDAPSRPKKRKSKHTSETNFGDF